MSGNFLPHGFSGFEGIGHAQTGNATAETVGTGDTTDGGALAGTAVVGVESDAIGSFDHHLGLTSVQGDASTLWCHEMVCYEKGVL